MLTAIVVGLEPPSSRSAGSEARTNDLDGGKNVRYQLDLPADGCEDGAAAIAEGDRTPMDRCTVIPRRIRGRCASWIKRNSEAIYPGMG
jgi:hypothetical protein